MIRQRSKDYCDLISGTDHTTLGAGIPKEVGIGYSSKSLVADAKIIVLFIVYREGEVLWIFSIADSGALMASPYDRVSDPRCGRGRLDY